MKAAGQLVASPVPSSLLETSDDTGVVMVDVGGGVGQVIEKVMEENPQVKGRFVLQDLGPIVEQARAKNPKFQVMEYDFFTPQPVQGTLLTDSLDSPLRAVPVKLP
jgi:16S rRNA A1518/A1519 N6-dimethyltransferase RsmA/KsgA/DIM1 with predicted DNA glycosylase/AP lyase activity